MRGSIREYIEQSRSNNECVELVLQFKNVPYNNFSDIKLYFYEAYVL